MSISLSLIKVYLLSSTIINLSLFNLCRSNVNDEPKVSEYIYFTFHTQSLSKSELDILNAKLESEYDRILAHHGLKSVRNINFHIFPNVTDLREIMKSKFPKIFVPDFATALTPTPTDVYMVTPSPRDYAIYIHEFTHCVTQHLNFKIPNNPRWLWESIALFEANQFVDPKNINALVSNNISSLHELNDFNNPLIYRIGYLLGAYIFKNFGEEKYIELIKENGNIDKVLALTEEEFIKAWYQYSKQHYEF